MSIPVNEQETTIGWYRDSDTAHVYTSDRTVMTRLDRLAGDPDSPWICTGTDSLHEDVISKTYTAPKNLLSFRRVPLSRVLTEEQKAEAAKRLKSYREFSKNQAERAEDDNLPT